MRREQFCTLPPFLLSQRVPGARLDCFLFPSAVCGDLLYSREFLLKSFVPGDFRTFVCFYAAGAKESHIVSFFFPIEKKKVSKKMIFLIKSGQTPRQCIFNKEANERKIKGLECCILHCQPIPSVSFPGINWVHKMLMERTSHILLMVMKVHCCLGGAVLHSIHTMPN